MIVDDSNRLGPNDAHHVQCLHTNPGKLGTSLRCGDSDYYPNFGNHQPGCFDDGCDHNRAVFLFESSMNPEYIYSAKNCQNAGRNQCSRAMDRFGIHGKHSSGQFYFETSSCYPYV